MLSSRSSRSSSSSSKSKPRKPTKGTRTTLAELEWRAAEEELQKINDYVAYLESQYRLDSQSCHAYVNGTREKLKKAYDQRNALAADAEVKGDRYREILAEIESSSDDSHRSRRSTSSKGSHGSSGGFSNASTEPTWLAWLCRCGNMNYHDPEGPNNRCACQHVFCGNPNCCQMQFNP
ncbi:hypothetical protein NQ176_g7979 [Zarea fungicola]|uniref:Uncharacterized protein n=1 Tax=Zarea fungicola TaxID=93591 RepID=A0ACC1MV42_9HYPO|nr:hypothetical protein NQ176_g7979 [Lecanicillium fungicola]